MIVVPAFLVDMQIDVNKDTSRKLYKLLKFCIIGYLYIDYKK